MTQYDPNRPDSRDLPVARPTDSLNPPRRGLRDPAPVRSGDEARQGPPGRPVLIVLIAALILALGAWALAELYPRGGSRLADTNAGEPRTTGATRQPNAGGIPLSPPKGSPESTASQGQTDPAASGRGQSSGASPTSDSAR